ncbi:MAG: hypothetical protein IH616_19680, partial [Gemmatimonadales bacterium]|nr:hypothetical protein [Gemmatimonadales bacterium]
MEAVVVWLQDNLGLSPAIQARILGSVLAIALLWALRRLALAVIWQRIDDVRLRYRWRKTTSYI